MKVIIKQKKVVGLGELDIDLSRLIEIDDPHTIGQLYKDYLNQHINEDKSFDQTIFDLFKQELKKEDPKFIYEIQQNIRNLD